MKRWLIGGGIILAVIILGLLIQNNPPSKPVNTNFSANTSTTENINIPEQANTNLANISQVPEFQSPLDRPKERITKKTFGIYITPQNSPVQPERFTGYHTGVDFEILPGEENVPVTVKAFCDGKLIQKGTASGYGGYAVQACSIAGQSTTVVYGHLDLATISNQGKLLAKGE